MTFRPTGRRIRVALVFAVLLTLLAAPVAKACSCFQGDPRDALAASDGAFIGTLTAIGASNDQGLGIYSFDVETAVKGDIGGSIEVQAGSNDANCGFEAQVGDRIGLFASFDGTRWVSGLCGQILPERLLTAAAPLPPPDGVGPVRFVVGVNIGLHRLMALDGRGRTLAYGRGDGYAIAVDLCPGSQRVVEVARIDRVGLLAVHDLPSLRTVRRVELVSGPPFPRAMAVCLNRAGSHLLAAERHGGEWWIHELRGSADRIVWHGSASEVAIDGRRVVIRDHRALSILWHGHGAPAPVATLPPRSHSMRLSPDGSWVAALRDDPTGEAQVLAVNVGDGSVGRYSLAPSTYVYGDVRWLSASRFVFLSIDGQNPSLIFRASTMEPSAGPSGWYAGSPVVSGGRVYGTAWGVLISARLPNGEPRTVRSFDSPETGVLDVVL